MKNMSMLTKILIFAGIIAGVAAACTLIAVKIASKCKCTKNAACDEICDDEALKDFEECCNSCYSECDDDI